MTERSIPLPEIMQQALILILRKTSGSCENFTTGIGSCYKNGRLADAKYGADQVCDSCIAHRALFVDSTLTE
jgi:hypothetical protein